MYILHPMSSLFQWWRPHGQIITPQKGCIQLCATGICHSTLLTSSFFKKIGMPVLSDQLDPFYQERSSSRMGDRRKRDQGRYCMSTSEIQDKACLFTPSAHPLNTLIREVMWSFPPPPTHPHPHAQRHRDHSVGSLGQPLIWRL